MIYTAAVLNENSRHLLRWLTKANTTLEADGFLFQTPQGDKLPHHMTINLGSFDESINSRSVLGGFVELHIDRVKFDYNIGACAAPIVKAQVELVDQIDQTSEGWIDLKTFNDHPHITTCLRPGVSAKFSNDMLASHGVKEVLFDQTYILEAWVQEVRPQKTYPK